MPSPCKGLKVAFVIDRERPPPGTRLSTAGSIVQGNRTLWLAMMPRSMTGRPEIWSDECCLPILRGTMRTVIDLPHSD